VVLVHGWPLSAATFRAIIPALARRFTLHLFDLPGTGHTEWRGAIDIASDAVALRAAIDRLGLPRYALLAHDSGGVMARLIAADDPRVAAVVLGNTEIPGHRSKLVEAYVTASRIPWFAPLLVGALGVGAIRRSGLGFGGCFTDASFVDGEFGRLFVQPMLRSRRVAEGQLALCRNLDFALVDRLPEVHARIHAPVRCIWGTRDPFFPIEKARRMLPQLAGPADLVEIPDAKLFAHEDHPDAFAAHALDFLARYASDTAFLASSRADAVDRPKAATA
jgi:pimeloyl-ACP methyl ester carboxylesterase